MNGKNASIKQAWVSVVDAQNIKDAKREAGKKLWFSLSPGKEWFKLSFQSFVRYDHFVRFLGIFDKKNAQTSPQYDRHIEAKFGRFYIMTIIRPEMKLFSSHFSTDNGHSETRFGHFFTKIPLQVKNDRFIF